MPYVFVSYVRQNQTQVERLARDLRIAGLEVWLDRDNLAAGAVWGEAIAQAIRSGAAFVACFSRDYLSRKHTYMDEELQVARTLLLTGGVARTWFIPIVLDDCSPSDVGLLNDAAFARLHCVSMAPDWLDGLRRILTVLSPTRAMGNRLNRLPAHRLPAQTEVPLLSLDFGTSNSLLAWRGNDSSWHPIGDPDGRTLHPSVVTFADNWDYWVGFEAMAAAAVRPDRAVFNIKRLLGQSRETQIGQKRFDSVTLAALVIRYLRDCAEALFGRQVEEVITAIPSGYSLAQSGRVVQACELAGLKVMRIIPEPNAAGIVTFDSIRTRHDLLTTPTNAHDLPGARILVIDMGGGTSDISLEEISDIDGDWQIEVVESSGDNELGGMDYDVAVYDFLKVKFVTPLSRHRLRWTPHDDRRLMLLARECKEALSRQDVFEATLSDVELQPGQLGTLLLPITRAEMAEAVRSLDARLLKHVESVTQGLGPYDPISAIILGGQGARCWSVANLLRCRFPSTEIISNYQENAVSLGLAIYANVLEGKCQNLLLLDAITHGVGVRCQSTAPSDTGLLICKIATRALHNAKIQSLIDPGSVKPNRTLVLLRPLTVGPCAIEVVELDRWLNVVSTIASFVPLVAEATSMLVIEINIDTNGAMGIQLRNQNTSQKLGRHVQQMTSGQKTFVFESDRDGQQILFFKKYRHAV